MADDQLPTTPSDVAAAETGAQATWWQRNHRKVWLWLAFMAAVTAPLWGGLLLLWLFSPSSPFPKN